MGVIDETMRWLAGRTICIMERICLSTQLMGIKLYFWPLWALGFVLRTSLLLRSFDFFAVFWIGLKIVLYFSWLMYY